MVKKNYVQNDFGYKIILDPKNFSSQKEIWVEKNFGSKNIKGKKKLKLKKKLCKENKVQTILSPKSFGYKNILSPIKILGPNNFGSHKVLIQKMWVQKSFQWKKKDLGPKNVSPPKFWSK